MAMEIKVINYDGKDRKLEFDIDGLISAEALSGKAFGEAMIDPFRGLMNINTLRAYLWSGLHKNNAELTMQEASEVLNAGIKAGKSLRDIINDIQYALKQFGILGTGESKGN
jgi:hypothetical protein